MYQQNAHGINPAHGSGYRSPENTLPSVGDLVHSISADISEASPQLLEDLLPQIKHAKETVRCGVQHSLRRVVTLAAQACR